MIVGHPPFCGDNILELQHNIQQRAVRLPKDLRVSKVCVKLLRILLKRDPNERAGFQDFWKASRAFVGLGCHGDDCYGSDGNMMNTTTIDGINHPNSPLVANLGVISEEEEARPATIMASSTTTTSATTNSVNENENNTTKPVHMVEESQKVVPVVQPQIQMQVPTYPLHRQKEQVITSGVVLTNSNTNCTLSDIDHEYSLL